MYNSTPIRGDTKSSGFDQDMSHSEQSFTMVEEESQNTNSGDVPNSDTNMHITPETCDNNESIVVTHDSDSRDKQNSGSCDYVVIDTDVSNGDSEPHSDSRSSIRSPAPDMGR